MNKYCVSKNMNQCIISIRAWQYEKLYKNHKFDWLINKEFSYKNEQYQNESVTFGFLNLTTIFL